MRVLFVHQNFPGQYVHLIQRLAAEGGHTLVGLGIEPAGRPLPSGIQYCRYRLKRGNTPGIHPLALETESKLIRAEACAAAAVELRRQGFVPELICAHAGWGESLLLPDVWPGVPLLSYQEFFYQPQGFDVGFDPELQAPPDWASRGRLRLKNAALLLSLEASSWNLTPTHFQLSSFPRHWQRRFSVIHDGIDVAALQRPAPWPGEGVLAQGGLAAAAAAGAPLITFVNRRLEPYRGCHTLIRAIPTLHRLLPEAHLLIIGAQEGVSYGAPCPQGSWKERFMAEIAGRYDPERLHFTGPLPRAAFLAALQRSACHIYLSYPFVLSWSLLEAMACGRPVVASATAPVQEVIKAGEQGLLVDFFQPEALAQAVQKLVRDPGWAESLGAAARQRVSRRYDLEHCLHQHVTLLQRVAANR